MLVEAGLPERVRQELMRHRDPRLTNQTYTAPARLRLRLAEALICLPRLDHVESVASGDTQIDSQSLVAEGRSAS